MPVSSPRLIQESGIRMDWSKQRCAYAQRICDGSRIKDSLKAFSKIADRHYPFFLDSGCDPQRLGRYSIMGCDPQKVIRSYAGGVQVETAEGTHLLSEDPIKTMEKTLSEQSVKYSGHLPFVGGAVGYFGYGLCRITEGIDIKGQKDGGEPDMEVGFYDSALVFDNLLGQAWAAACGTDRPDCEKKIKSFIKLFERNPKEKNRGVFELSRMKSNFTKEGYISSIRKIKEYIREGDTYQVNLSQRYGAKAELDPFELYKRLRSINPAPFAAYLGFKGSTILCSSPERFLSLRNGIIRTRPIKGTRPRAKDGPSDEKMKAELLDSEKDAAEHIMIVDLERNDLGKICEYGSVLVKELKIIESYPTVHHLVSTIKGRVRKGISQADCIRACFPGGSITGAPKFRAMQIIDELEPTPRGVYTGSIGYLGYEGSMDLNIVIRTMVYREGRIFFNVGGGIVADSNALDEFAETTDKGRALFKSLGIIV